MWSWIEGELMFGVQQIDDAEQDGGPR
jgi:hypothetical protein